MTQNTHCDNCPVVELFHNMQKDKQRLHRLLELRQKRLDNLKHEQKDFYRWLPN